VSNLKKEDAVELGPVPEVSMQLARLYSKDPGKLSQAFDQYLVAANAYLSIGEPETAENILNECKTRIPPTSSRRDRLMKVEERRGRQIKKGQQNRQSMALLGRTEIQAESSSSPQMLVFIGDHPVRQHPQIYPEWANEPFAKALLK